MLDQHDRETTGPLWLQGREIDVAGKAYMRDARGNLAPVETIRPLDLLVDESVRKIAFHAAALSAQIARFKAHTFDDIGALQALVAQEYGATIGGAKGNITMTSFDGCLRVQVQVADRIEFGPELQAAKQLVDECLSEWSADGRAELRAVVTRAFQVDKEGKINRAEIFMLLRTEIEDERWKRAMAAVRDSIRIVGSRLYVRMHRRADPQAAWEPISIDLASA
jgi:hypothetical protein